jgi:hypothetical protein
VQGIEPGGWLSLIGVASKMRPILILPRIMQCV